MATQPDTTTTELEQAYAELERARARVMEARRKVPATEVSDYTFQDADGQPIALSALFGAHDDLLVIHNMGTFCAYCTMWADGFNGLLPHLADRAAFVVISPDDPTAQQRFARERGWRFRMVSSRGTTFREDMGFASPGVLMPGVSAFHRTPDGTLTHVAHAFFGPGDLYCAAWHLFDLLPSGGGDWEPRFTYAAED
jgi:predicted dithiol-disulfide oxidoreductase (DUF899 family)